MKNKKITKESPFIISTNPTFAPINPNIPPKGYVISQTM
jgi:hypothetical protein